MTSFMVSVSRCWVRAEVGAYMGKLRDSFLAFCKIEEDFFFFWGGGFDEVRCFLRSILYLGFEGQCWVRAYGSTEGSGARNYVKHAAPA